MNIADLNLSTRTLHSFLRSGKQDADELAAATFTTLRALPGVGPDALKEMALALFRAGRRVRWLADALARELSAPAAEPWLEANGYHPLTSPYSPGERWMLANVVAQLGADVEWALSEDKAGLTLWRRGCKIVEEEAA